MSARNKEIVEKVNASFAEGGIDSYSIVRKWEEFTLNTIDVLH